MAYQATILLDSIGVTTGVRLTTFLVEFPRIILAEVNTHRVLSRNYESSRAVPVEKRIERVLKDPFIPVEWGKNRKGMQAITEIEDTRDALLCWLDARDAAVTHARRLAELGLHKQVANRIIEPWTWVKGIITATDWANFFNLRCSSSAQPEFRYLADMMLALYLDGSPTPLMSGDWAIPMVTVEERETYSVEVLRKLAVARISRVSFDRHAGETTIERDIASHDQRAADGHFSPFEHVAQATLFPTRSGNFTGWNQYRKMMENENRTDISALIQARQEKRL